MPSGAARARKITNAILLQPRLNNIKLLYKYARVPLSLSNYLDCLQYFHSTEPIRLLDAERDLKERGINRSLLPYCCDCCGSALYSASNLALMINLKWLCRVPLTIKEAKQLVSTISEEQLVNSEIEGYKLAVHKSHYGGIEQRWLVVESQSRREADQHKLQQKLSQSEKEAQKKLKQLCTEKFTCPLAAIEVAQRFGQKLKYHNLTNIQAVELKANLQPHFRAIVYSAIFPRCLSPILSASLKHW